VNSRLRYSDEVLRLEPPASIRSAQRARELIAAGEPVIDLSAGQPDFPVPPEIIIAAERAMREGHTGYTASAGIAPLREAIADHLHDKHRLKADPTRVLVTPGAKSALFDLLRATLNPGDRVLIPEPSWLSYGAMVRLAGGTPVPVAARPEDDFLVQQDLLASVAQGARAIILNNPVNPTGAIWPSEMLAGVAQIATRHDLLVIADEIYDDLLYNLERLPSIACYEGMDERTVQVHGFSKTYAMTGFRLGYLRGPRALIDQVQKVHEQIATCAPNVSQHAALAALRLDHTRHIQDIRALYRGRLEAVQKACQEGNLPFIDPGGAFYLFVDFRDRDPDSVRAAEFMLKSCLVALVPGVAYGACGEGWLRLSLTAPTDQLCEAVRRITSANFSRFVPE
jgi:aspartate/methionine/tyrosine aminotransferase